MSRPIQLQPGAVLHKGASSPAAPGANPRSVSPPQRYQWMEKPLVAGCPPGLECLAQLDHLVIKEQVDLLEVLASWASCNRYEVKSSSGQKVYFAMEESDALQRLTAGKDRGFIIHVTDSLGQEVIRVSRENKIFAVCSCCADSDSCVAVEAPVGQIVGYVRQMGSCGAPCYAIMDSQNTIVLRIEGPSTLCQDCCCTSDLDFALYTANSAQQVGKISKQWAGVLQEHFTSADNFGMSFPVNLDVKIKAVVLGALFLIDFMFFDTSGRQRK